MRTAVNRQLPEPPIKVSSQRDLHAPQDCPSHESRSSKVATFYRKNTRLLSWMQELFYDETLSLLSYIAVCSRTDIQPSYRCIIPPNTFLLLLTTCNIFSRHQRSSNKLLRLEARWLLTAQCYGEQNMCTTMLRAQSCPGRWSQKWHGCNLTSTRLLLCPVLLPLILDVLSEYRADTKHLKTDLSSLVFGSV